MSLFKPNLQLLPQPQIPQFKNHLRKKLRLGGKMSKKKKKELFYYTFATAVYTSEEQSLPENERKLQIVMTDIVLDDSNQNKINSALNYMVTEYAKKGLFAVESPRPTYLKRSKTSIGRFFEKSKREIFKADRNIQETLKQAAEAKEKENG